MKGTYPLLIFDFDGTLADTYPAFEVAFREAVPQFKLDVGETLDIGKLRGMGAREIIRELRLPLWKVPRVASFVRARMAAQPLRLFAGMDAVLRTLDGAGTTLAVVSSNSERNVRAGLGEELAGRFATFGCGASLFGKASRFRQVLRRLNRSPAEALAIGDEVRDAEAAAAVGIAFGAVAWGYTTMEGLERCQPARSFHAPSDLLQLVA